MKGMLRWIRRNQSAAILVGIAVPATGIILVINVNRQLGNDSTSKAQLALQQDEADLVGSALDYYYVQNRHYPVEISDAISGNANERDAYNDLPGHDYKVSGDKKSYELTWKDKRGKAHAKRGSYEKDYH